MINKKDEGPRMYISNSTANNAIKPIVMSKADHQTERHATTPQIAMNSNADTVNISDAARRLMQTMSEIPASLPTHPIAPLPQAPKDSDIKGDYMALKKTQYKYNVASDAISLATGQGDGLSASSAHYLAHHDEARAATVSVYAVQSQAQLAQSFMAETSSEDEDTSYNTSGLSSMAYDEALLAASVNLLAAQKQEQIVSDNMAKTAA